MYKRLSIIVFCIVVGIAFSTISYSQDDPATTETKEIESTDTGTADTGTTEPGTVVSPDAKVYYLSGNIFANAKVQFKLQAKDNLLLDKIMYRIDSGDYQVYQNPFLIETEGNHLISYYGVDKIGNMEEAKLFRVIIDTTAPDVTVTNNSQVISANGKYYISKNFTFTIEAYDALSGVNKVEYTLNGEAKEYTAPFSIASDGEIEMKVSAVDNVNNSNDQYSFIIRDDKGKVSTLREGIAKFAVDNTPPAVQITPSEVLNKTADDKNIASTNVKYGVSATDADSGVASIQVRIDNVGDFAPYFNEIKFKTNGEHSIEAKAIDRVGNVSEVTSLSVFVDTIAPESKLDTIPE
ncbi:MAG: hypothetical protein JXA20_18500 [Spirochaetes bacterium]|nr:hypothetical protein [Spirochaetota bacterium]